MNAGRRKVSLRKDIGARHIAIRLASLAMLLAGLLSHALPVEAQSNRTGPVYVAEIHGQIELGISAFLDRVIGDAEGANAAAVILDINTPGGRLDSALDMKNTLLGAEVPTIAFINREAFSAGALIAISTNRIYVAPGAVIGAATPVTQEGETASEKTVSAVRTAFRSVAEERGLDPNIAEAMVDPAVRVEGLVESGQLLTLTASEALEYDYAVAEAPDLQALLEAEDLAGRELITESPGLAETAVRFITNPVVASLLVSIGFLGLLYELISPGFGIGGAIGLLSLAAFFWGHLLAGLAGWEGVALVVVGGVLIAVEALIIPGFGVAGISGIIAFLAGIFISMVGNIPTVADYTQALVVVLASFLTIIIGAYFTVRYMPTRALGGLVLVDKLARVPRAESIESEDAESETESLVGATGVAMTDLHPSGTVRIDDERVDVVAEEGYVPRGSTVEIILDHGYRRVVRMLEAPPDAGADETESAS